MDTLSLCFILSCLPLTLHAVVGPRFTHLPEPLVAPIGDDVEFECALDVPAEQIRWKHNLKYLSKGAAKNATKSQLIFRVEHDSEGEYQCVAWYGASALASTPARLSLATLGPSAPAYNSKFFVAAGNNVLINCTSPPSNPPADIQYYRNDLPLQNGQVLASGTLLLLNVTQADSGKYSCSVRNNFVADSMRHIPSYHNLNVLTSHREKTEAPRVTFPPTPSYVTQVGSNVTLECVGFGWPVPRVQWVREDGTPLLQGRMRVVPAGLALTEVRPADEGVYICDINNGIPPSTKFRISLSVLEPPTILKGPEDREAKEGGRTSLTCSVRGKPTPRVYWMLNGNVVPNDSSEIRVYGDRLELSKVEKKHAGWYQCMAQNEVGAAFNTSQVLVVPRQVTVNITQDYEPYEPPFKQTTPIHRKKHHKNKKDMVPPSRPSVTRLTDNSVMVRWHVPPNTGLPITFFKVQYRELRKGQSWCTHGEDIPFHVHSIEIVNLTPNAYYRFRIAAVYSNMDNLQGPTSAKFHLTSDPKQVPLVPRLTHLSAVGPTAIKIGWEYNSTKLRVEGFYVHYRSTSSAGDYSMATVEGETARSYVVSHLKPDTSYEFKLQTFTVDAPSNFSEILTQKTERPADENPPNTSSTPPSDVGADEGSRGGNQLYVTLLAVVGGLLLLFALCTGIFCCNKQRQHHSTGTEDDDVDKSRHIQMETIHVNGHVGVGSHLGNHVAGSREGGVVVSKSNGCCNKMNITSNPLDAEENKVRQTQNLMEIAFITRNSCEANCNSVLTARLASAAVLPSCAMESESWRRSEIPRPVDSYV